MDKDLLQIHLKDILHSIGEGFAMQKGMAYGFHPDAPTLESNKEHVLNQGPKGNSELLNKFMTHSLPIENAFGHLDLLIRKFGPQGFQKAAQTIQISSAKDLVFDNNFEWKNITVKKRKELQVKQQKWSSDQEKLLEAGVKPHELGPIERSAKMTKLIETLKTHNGPLNSDTEIDQFLSDYKDQPAAKLTKMLNDEIRFRRDANLRLSLTKDCYLFRQRNLTNEQRIANLRLLVKRPEAKSSATLSDIKTAYNLPIEPSSEERTAPDTQSTSVDDTNLSSILCHGLWPPQLHEHLAIRNGSCFSIIECIKNDDVICCKLLRKYDLLDAEQLHLYCDTNEEAFEIEIASVFPVRPILDIVPSMSTLTRSRGKLIYQLENYDVLAAFCKG